MFSVDSISKQRELIRMKFGNCCLIKKYLNNQFKNEKVQLVGAVEYSKCISAENSDFSNECFGHDTKRSDDDAPVLEL